MLSVPGHRKRQLIYTATAAVVATIALVFTLEIIDEVVEGSLDQFDQLFLTLVSLYRSPGLTTTAFILHSLLQLPYVLLVIAPIFIYLYRTRRYKMALAVGLVMFLSLVVTFAIKWLVFRPRPAEATIQEIGASFPSGHAAGAVVVYGLMAYVAWRYMVKDIIARLVIVVMTTALIIATGLSRIYLLVHYPSDVAAGWTVGAVLLFGAIALLEFVRRR